MFWGGVVKNMLKFEISNGHNWGAIWSNRDETLSCDTAMTSSCSGGGSQGAWGLGRWEKVENCFMFGPLFLKFSKKMKKLNEIGQICSDWADIDPERFPASSFRLLGGGLANCSKKYGKNKIRIL